MHNFKVMLKEGNYKVYDNLCKKFLEKDKVISIDGINDFREI